MGVLINSNDYFFLQQDLVAVVEVLEEQDPVFAAVFSDEHFEAQAFLLDFLFFFFFLSSSFFLNSVGVSVEDANAVAPKEPTNMNNENANITFFIVLKFDLTVRYEFLEDFPFFKMRKIKSKRRNCKMQSKPEKKVQ